jgi:hypothetical protein
MDRRFECLVQILEMQQKNLPSDSCRKTIFKAAIFACASVILWFLPDLARQLLAIYPLWAYIRLENLIIFSFQAIPAWVFFVEVLLSFLLQISLRLRPKLIILITGVVLTFLCAFILDASFAENTWKRAAVDYFVLNKRIFLLNSAGTISIFALLYYTSVKGIFPRRKGRRFG